MTLTLQLTPEQDARLRAEAEQRGMSVEDYVLYRALSSGDAPHDSLTGLFADDPDMVDAVLADIMEARRTDVLRLEDG